MATKTPITSEIPADFIRAYLNYDPDTGKFTRRFRSAGVNADSLVGHKNTLGYVIIGVLGRHYPAHRLAWAHVYCEWPSSHLDHINGDPSDNRISNLRLATRSQNKANGRLYKNSSVGLKGVRYHKPSGKYQARIGYNGKRLHLGYYDFAEEAHAAYAKAARQFFGEFARMK